VIGVNTSADFFSRGGQNFPDGARGAKSKTYYLPKNALKHTIFFLKSRKTYYFCRPRGGAGGEGANAPSCPPLQTPMHVVAILS